MLWIGGASIIGTIFFPSIRNEFAETGIVGCMIIASVMFLFALWRLRPIFSYVIFQYTNDKCTFYNENGNEVHSCFWENIISWEDRKDKIVVKTSLVNEEFIIYKQIKHERIIGGKIYFNNVFFAINKLKRVLKKYVPMGKVRNNIYF